MMMLFFKYLKMLGQMSQTTQEYTFPQKKKKTKKKPSNIRWATSSSQIFLKATL